GDFFDEAMCNEVERRARKTLGIGDETEVYEDVRRRLLHACEEAKIELSNRNNWNVYVDYFFKNPDHSELKVSLSRGDLQEIVGSHIKSGIERIHRLLEREALSPASDALCLATGGMSNMPMIVARLHELFGPQRV